VAGAGRRTEATAGAAANGKKRRVGEEEEARRVKGSNHGATAFSALFTRHGTKGPSVV
jgi:hypothetical protein